MLTNTEHGVAPDGDIYMVDGDGQNADYELILCSNPDEGGDLTSGTWNYWCEYMHLMLILHLHLLVGSPEVRLLGIDLVYIFHLLT